MRKYSFDDHPEHRAELEAWRDKWIANAMSTKPMDDEEREICRKAVIKMYADIGLPEPNIVFVQSPFILRFATGFAAEIWKRRGRNSDATAVAIRAATAVATRDATYDDKWYVFPVEEMIRLANKLGIGVDGIEHTQNTYSKYWQGGNQWSAWDSYLTFFRYIAKLEIDYSKYDAWEQLLIHSGPRCVHEQFCIISDRPEILKVDAQNRPHCDTGPFCQWRDGSKLYAIHGVRVPAWIITNPELITPEKIQAEANAEIRREMMKIYGWDRMLADVDATLVDKHPDPHIGELWSYDDTDGTTIKINKCQNGTLNPFTGQYDWYTLRVPTDTKTAVDANRWTYPLCRSMSDEEYIELCKTRT